MSSGSANAHVVLAQASSYLEDVFSKNPILAPFLEQISQDFQKKLWHELTIKITSFVKMREVREQLDLIQFYENFIKSFEVKLNQLSLVRIIVDISSTIQDLHQRIQFIKAFSQLPKVVENNEATVTIKAVLAEFHIVAGDLNEAKSVLEQTKLTLDATSGAEANVFAAFHRAWAAYYKVKGDFENFYSSALQYLGYSQTDTLDKMELLGLARDLVIAALLGQKLFSLGELMENEILTSLRNSPEAWLVDILAAFNVGNLQAWYQLQQEYAYLIANSALKDKIQQLTAKAKILSLIELVFNKPSGQRIISFEVISQTSDVPIDQVELLVMKALSLGLLRGTIDEVDQVVSFTWVQPRILNLQQISQMKTRLASWVDNVKSSLNLVENETASELIS
uniref:PCI domain-containing protein n=1 Tax=Arcella intermedia TaxID=1963864 RepID=A0A6B2L693_9EUKA